MLSVQNNSHNIEIDYDEEGERMEMADESQSVDDSDDDIEMNTEVSHSISLQCCAFYFILIHCYEPVILLQTFR